MNCPFQKSKWIILNRNLFLFRFDETYDLLLPEDTDRTSAYILFTVKDKGVMGEGIFLGESILPLRKIIRDGENVDLKVLRNS